MLQGIGLILVGGMIAHVVAAAAIGHKLSLGQAWAATHGKRWRLIGLTFLLGLTTTLLLALYVLSWVPVALTAPSWQDADGLRAGQPCRCSSPSSCGSGCGSTTCPCRR